MVRERLQKILSSAGVASRRGAEALIAAGDVSVNGAPARLGDLADSDVDEIVVGGIRLSSPVKRTYLALNKPTGFVCSLRSTHGERTVMDLMPGTARLYPVGRLDKETSGLLLMTDDGDWANLVAHPRYEIEKEYRALVTGLPDAAALRRLREGVGLPDGSVTVPARVERIGDDRGNAWLSITVVEGKKRQIRLMANAVAHPVLVLRRVRIGSVKLGELPEGQWRTLAREEVDEIRDVAGRNARAHRADTRNPR
jgi:23S rRNA pseudouridine2605 synthase